MLKGNLAVIVERARGLEMAARRLRREARTLARAEALVDLSAAQQGEVVGKLAARVAELETRWNDLAAARDAQEEIGNAGGAGVGDSGAGDQRVEGAG